MGILKSLFTLGKSFISQAEESIEETQGVRMLEQHIRDAKAELDKAGKSRVDLLARVKLSHDKLKDLRERKASLEARALEALSKNVNPSLINEVAEEIARLENLITAEEQVLSNLEVSRDGVEKAVTATAQRIAQFEQQMEVVKATEAMQRAQQAVTTSTVGASSSVSTAAESLKRLQTRQAERQARLDAAAQLEKVADGRPRRSEAHCAPATTASTARRAAIVIAGASGIPLPSVPSRGVSPLDVTATTQPATPSRQEAPTTRSPPTGPTHAATADRSLTSPPPTPGSPRTAAKTAATRTMRARTATTPARERARNGRQAVSSKADFVPTQLLSFPGKQPARRRNNP